MVELSSIPKEIAVELLKEVTLGEHFEGYRMIPMEGNAKVLFFSLEEVVNYLSIDVLGNLLLLGSYSSIGYIDFDKLRSWIEEVYGDEELSKAIGQEIKKDISFKEKIESVIWLMEQRLNQCKTITKII